nr:hypothetical protein [Hyphomonas sp. Mor2]
MSDAISSQAPIDPDRPWITEEDGDPAKMNWLDTFLNPTGASPKLHFTRAWTVLFFAGVLAWPGYGLASFIAGAAGMDTSGLSAFHGYLIAGVVGVSSVLSFVIHSRRLNHAGKTSLWAIIILVPLALGSLAFLGGITGKAAEYQDLYDKRAVYLEDPAAWRAERLEERRQAQAEAEKARQEAEAARANGEEPGGEGAQNSGQNRGQNGGRPGGFGNGPSPENPLPTKEAFIVRPNIGAFYNIIVLLSIPIMIWSLTWVARTPNYGKSRSQTDGYGEVDGPFS